MIFDTHAHYEDEAFDEDRDEMIRSLPDYHVQRFVNVASTWDSLEKTRNIAENYKSAYAAYGIHPDNVGELDDQKMAVLKEYLQLPKAVAVGEIGLDYHWSKDNREQQIYWFRRQLSLAREMKLPVIIHSRDAAQDTMTIAKEEGLGEIGGVIHCYAYSTEQALEYVKMGLYIGVGGVVTFKNARRLKETVQAIPMEHIVLETDCPYLAPEPNRGTRNSSRNLRYVVRTIAGLKQITAEEVELATWRNACKMYHIPGEIS
ncbi:MAG: TatD family hydrolase [Bilifractor sp.]